MSRRKWKRERWRGCGRAKTLELSQGAVEGAQPAGGGVKKRSGTGVGCWAAGAGAQQRQTGNWRGWREKARCAESLSEFEPQPAA